MELRIGLFKRKDETDVFIKKFGDIIGVIKIYLKEDNKEFMIETDLVDKKIRVIKDKEVLEKDLKDNKELWAFKISF